MSKATVRYCVMCGREIGRAAVCPNPDCRGTPNFYRDVPRRESESRCDCDPKRQPQPGRRPPSTSETLDDRVTLYHPPARSGYTDRVTVPIQFSAVAVLRSTNDAGKEHLIYPGATEVGARPPARIVIDQPQVSSRHARLDFRETRGGWEIIVTDHQSTNGTWVNGKRVWRCRLRRGDRVRFATVEFEVWF